MNKTVFTFEEFKGMKRRYNALWASKVGEIACDQRIKKGLIQEVAFEVSPKKWDASRGILNEY